VEFALAKGGPTGVFLFGHLHGIHRGKGHTDYTAAAYIQDSGGYTYAVTPALTVTVRKEVHHGRGDDVHEHCAIHVQIDQSTAQALLKGADAADKPLLHIVAGGDRKTVLTELATKLGEPASEEFGKYFSGEIDLKQLLAVINAGKNALW
jgi:hypothetical protein